MRSSVEISRSAAREVVIASLAGDVDMVQVPNIQGALEAALADDAGGLVIDLSAVQYFDSTGVRWLFDVQRKLQFSRHQFRLVVPEDGLVRHVLRIVNIDKFILVHPTVDAALADLAAAGAPSIMRDAER